ncbi:hypothetical protein JL721_3429 [Aureococcus anophagefferens]|nr:hypothetical protein JL721_3429 [Aureococcus anophagefferens]
MSAFWLVFYSLKFGFQLLELALCVAFAALFFAYHQRRELATAWVQWFFGLEALIRGDAQIQVEWRGADDLADGDNDTLGRALRLRREAVVADVLVLRARFPPKDAPPEDGDPRGEAFCALGVSLHTARVRVVSYDGGLSDTSLARVQKAVKEAFDARRRGARALTPEEARRADEIKRRDDVVAAVVVTDRRGNFVAQPYERAELAHYEFATATPVYACVLFERRRDGWRATATYGLDYACERIKRKARERGGPLERFRETETPAASQDEIRRLFGARWCKTESVTVGHLRVKAYDGAGRALSGHEATLSHMILEPRSLTGMDAKSGVASAASVLDQGVEDLQHAGARAGGALGGPAEMLVLGTTDAARSVVHGAVDGAVEITSGIALGGKLAVTGLIHSAQDGDPGRFATSLVRASDEAVSGVLQGVAVAADGVHDGARRRRGGRRVYTGAARGADRAVRGLGLDQLGSRPPEPPPPPPPPEEEVYDIEIETPATSRRSSVRNRAKARRTSLTIQAALGNGRCGDDADAPDTFRDRLVRYDSEKPNTTNI